MRRVWWIASAIVAVPIALPGAPQVNPNWSLSGRVVDAASGQPIAGAEVTAVLDSQPDYRYLAGTDANGAYHFDRVRSGYYFVFVKVKHWTIDPSWRVNHVIDLAQPGTPLARTSAPILDVSGKYRLEVEPRSLMDRVKSGTFTYATTFFPNALTSAQARRVAIGSDIARPGVDIGLRRVSGHRVTGTVEGPAFEPPNGPGEALSLATYDDDRFQVGSTASTLTQDGAFVFMSVPPGTYTIEAREAVHGDIGGRSHGRVPNAVTVGDRDVSGLTVKVPVK